MNKLIVIWGLLYSCATDPTMYPPAYYGKFDPELHPYVQRYERHLGRAVDNVYSIRLVDTINEGPNVIGVCYRGSKLRVEILASYFWESTPIQVETLIYHELGHCAQGLGHNTEPLENDCPSIMYPYILAENVLAGCWNTMTENLFDNGYSLTGCYVRDQEEVCI